MLLRYPANTAPLLESVRRARFLYDYMEVRSFDLSKRSFDLSKRSFDPCSADAWCGCTLLS